MSSTLWYRFLAHALVTYIEPMTPGSPPLVEEVEVKSVSDLLTDLSTYSNDELLWYRGQARSSWLLEPSLVRLDGVRDEKPLMEEFKRDAIPLLTRADLSGWSLTEWDWMFIMQHYHVPTRLLDWSESPLIGLFFALDETGVDDAAGPAALWLLKPQVLNEAARVTYDQKWRVPVCDVTDEKDDDVGKYLPSQLATGRRLDPLALIGIRRFDRIRAQSGAFTIAHRDPRPLEIEAPQALKKYIIPHDSKEFIREELDRLGVHAASIYPDLEHLGRRVGRRIS
ncbi:FRG domain-containing protein [Pseudarthrobacter sp. NKDBFgelt]|uniref:FRG domain-containing protein n=1 Tax=Pseudarthrobacter sp. NKDBFgelt TaxID=3384443 RepID=UPI0038D3BB38